MDIRIVSEVITAEELKSLANGWFGSLIKGVADVEREVVALGGEYHVDALEELLKNGSAANDVWGFNILVDESPESDTYIEYTSLINIRPAAGNREMEIKDAELREKIRGIIKKLIK